MLEGLAQAAYRGQARGEAGGVPLHNMRASLLLTEFPDDAYLHLPQVEARGNGANSVFLVTTRTELARRAAAILQQGEPSRPQRPYHPPQRLALVYR